MSTNLTTRNPRRTGPDILGRLFYGKGKSGAEKDDEFFYIVTKAKQDIKDAENYFDNVTDPELIDHAIYKMEAAKSHYTYLIKLAKERGVKLNI